MIKMFLPVVRTIASRMLISLSKKLMNLSLRMEKTDLLSEFEKTILSRNIIFKDKHRNQRGFVIVNGPSLKNQNLEPLKNEITFVVSGFWKHEIINIWEPTYYSLLDKNFFLYDKHIVKFYDNLNRKIKKSIFFMPLYRGYEANEKHHFIQSSRTYFIACYGAPFPSVELTTLIQGFAGVSAFALAQAIYMGCNPIYLLGFDHDYLAYRGIDRHFYEENTIQGSILGTIPMVDLIPYDKEMEANINLWKNYRSLKDVADQKNIKIYNATDGGYLDVFDRTRYEDIFNF